MSTIPRGTTSTGFVPLAVPKSVFLGLVWGSLGFSLVFLLFRIYVRQKVFQRLFWDDFTICVSWIILLISAAIWQSMIDDLYIIYAISTGAISPPNDLVAVLKQYVQQTFAVTFLNLCSLWLVKTSFLIFFHKLGHNVRGHKLIWWTAVVACIIGFLISVGVQNYRCISGTLAEMSGKCGSPSYGAFVRRSLRLQAACDVISDAFILAVPIKILWNVQISFRSKLALILLFSLSMFTMVVAVIKVTLTIRTKREDDSWLYMWAAVESAVAIIIASAISYRALANQDKKKSKDSEQSSARAFRYDANSCHSHGNSNEVRGGKSSSDSSLEGEEVVPLDTIRVKREYNVVPASIFETGTHEQSMLYSKGEPNTKTARTNRLEQA